MANHRKIRLTPPSPESSNYGVGYGKPPAASRFTPGQSGNRKGRPKGARNKRPGPHEERLKEIILEEAYRGVKMNDGKRHITVPLLKAVVRSLAVSAARGQLRSQQAFTKLVFETERDRKAPTKRSKQQSSINSNGNGNSIAANSSELRAGSPFLIQTMSKLIRTPVTSPSKALRTRQRRPNGMIGVSASRTLIARLNI
jgi:hypothetical protein